MEAPYDAHLLGDAEVGRFWTSIVRWLKPCSLDGVQPLTSDAHIGHRAAIGSAPLGASWQRCCVHFVRNLVGTISMPDADTAAAQVRTIFA